MIWTQQQKKKLDLGPGRYMDYIYLLCVNVINTSKKVMTHAYLRYLFSRIYCNLSASFLASTGMLPKLQTSKSLVFQCLQRFVEVF